jgi:ISXO2-like transposase domain
MKHKIIEAMRLAEQDRQFSGRIEIDDAYLGAERSGCTPGRGSENKIPFVMAAQSIGAKNKPHRVCIAQIPFRLGALAEFCGAHLVRPLTVVSDGLACFNAAAASGVHERIVTGGGKASYQHPEFQAVNIALSNLKTALSGTYHAFKFAKYARRYLTKYQFRSNRREEMRHMLRETLQAMLNAPPASDAALRIAESAC